MVKRPSWLFRRLNLTLRTEVIINISLLMLAAIFLIVFTTSKANETNIVQGRIRIYEGMIQDFQTVVDFMLHDEMKRDFNDPLFRKAIQDFIQFFGKERRIHQLMVVNSDQRVIASQKQTWINTPFHHPTLSRALQTGVLSTELEKEGGFFATEYKKLVVSSPLWMNGKVIGGIVMEAPIEDVIRHLFEYQKMILVLIILDSIVLIVFGSFLLSRVLVKPVKDLVRLTQKISEGDFNQTIEVTSRNEIGQLISSFNRMIEQLKENQENIKSHLESLELANIKLKQAQEELIRTEKLASIGRFAAGVAHEVGNPLGSILGYTSILGQGEVTREESKDYLKRIEKEIDRISRIVRELLNFARPSKVEIREVQMNQVIENTLSLLSYQKNFKNIETRMILQPNLPKVKGDESQLSQVFINIILNAVDAMPTGGILEICTETFVVGKGSEPRDDLFPLYFRRKKSSSMENDFSHLRGPNPFSTPFAKFLSGERLVKIRIADTGIGIKKDDLEKIFDPFFTTKDPDKGTGLGLSVSLRIVESLGGEIKVESEEGRGSTFEVYLPIAIDR